MIYKQVILAKVIQQLFLAKRQKSGLTQLGLALKSKITRQFISQVESGKRAPSIFTISILASACKMTLAELFQEVDRLYNFYDSVEGDANDKPARIAASPRCCNAYIKNIKDVPKQ